MKLMLRVMATGEEATIEDECHATWAEAEFIWTQGNYACDCNRRLFIDRAKGVEHDDVTGYPCGDGAIRIAWVEGSDYSELPWRALAR